MINVFMENDVKRKTGRTGRNTITAILCLAMIYGLTGCDRKQENTLVVFEGGSLTTEDVAAHRESMRQMKEFRNYQERLTPEFVFEHALNMEMIIAKGLDMKLHLDPRIREHLHRQMSETFLKLIGEQLVPPIDRKEISDEEARQYYQEHLESYQEKPRYALYAFSVAPDKLKEVEEALDGTMSYEDAAAHYGSTPQERESHGYTGSRTLSRFQPSWQPIVEAMEIDEIQGPLLIDGRHYFLMLKNKTELHQYSFEEKKEYIRNDVLYDRYRQAWDAVYAGLRQDFKVDIDQKRVADFIKDAASSTEENIPEETPR